MPGALHEEGSAARLPDAAWLRRERIVVVLYLLFTAATLAHFVHDGWYNLSEGSALIRACLPSAPIPTELGGGKVTPPPQGFAPNAYRVAMPWLNAQVQRLPGLHRWLTAATLIEFVFAFAALGLCYLLLVQDDPRRPWSRPARVTSVAFLLAALHFPLQWVVPFLRPETMPSAFYLAASLFVLAKWRGGARQSVLLLVLALMQGFVRSDVSIVLGLSLMVISVLGKRLTPTATRGTGVLLGAAVAGVAGAAQAYLQFVRFPHTPYPPGVPMLMGPNNVSPHQLGILAMALLPWLAFAAGLLRWRGSLRPVDMLTIAAALLYLPVWLMLGLAAEVRIFVPFLVVLSVPAARCITQWLVCDTADPASAIVTSR